MQDFFFEAANRVFFCFQASFCPVKRGIRAGSCRNESDHSRRGTQISFPLLESRSCENFGLLIAHFSIVYQVLIVRKLTVDQIGGALFDQLFFSSKKI